ncbi:MAG: amino acid permease [Limisphaerales bacterium]
MTPTDSSEDERQLRLLGYEPELARRMSGFSNFAISLSIICILAGGITSFHVGLGSAGGASLGLGWPLACLCSLAVALTMAQIASAFPTAGGLYHWGCILGGRGLGWCTAWFNLAGLVTVLAAINAGTYDFAVATFGLPAGADPVRTRMLVVIGMLLSQALLNHYGIRLTTRLTDLSGWVILGVSAVMTLGLLLSTRNLEWSRLWTWTNFSGLPESGPIFPKQSNLLWLFCLGLLLPAYTITGFDASAHTSEETVGAARNVPRGIVRSVAVSAAMGWMMIAALLLAMPSVREGVEQGAGVVPWILKGSLPAALAWLLLVGIVLAQYICGLAALTSASRMTFAFARDGGLPGSAFLRRVNRRTGSPSTAVWNSAAGSALLIILLRYETIAAIGTVFLYLSYVLPVAAGWMAHGRWWTRFGPWHLGRAYRPLAMVSVVFCVFLLVIGVQPPNEQAVPIVGGVSALMVVVWFGLERRRFRGPPRLDLGR